ncbi:acyl-CoA dehydrogenase family protein [Streptomyces coffeae]|uniref:Acyl-CoA dehydrogenase family protein n=1 Tax=Streptomyces coffeae TaxID=621382 RepID=A0ABS1NQC9_9ACTN|nr:acyl-CoA dehydrogenase family protein [Streptomyces coffeae]MBL1102097.1 acyl-CoA dehydrogenase family protein [Streptomyces coffeae]
MSKSTMTALAVRLEQYLGDPHDPASRVPFAQVLDHDERGRYPYEFLSLLRRWGVPAYSLPAEQGGKAGNVETSICLMRLVARRDPSTAIGLSLTSLGFMPAWILGTEQQKCSLIADITCGGAVSWGLSERAHGSDLVANEVVAEKVEGGYALTGEKWPIGNATVADKIIVFARTARHGGPAAYSLFILDKWQTGADTIEDMPCENLYGVRAANLSGIRMNKAFVPESALIGGEGQGLEIAIKTSLTARVVLLHLALSAVDTSLRLAMDFAERRVLLGDTIIDVPYTRRQLAEAFADLMVADAMVLGAARSLQVVPEQVSVWSSVAKYLVPTLLQKTMAQLTVVLGARTFMRDHPHYGMHQKMLRDILLTDVTDGNTVVNLRNLGHQLGRLLDRANASEAATREAAAERAATLFGMDRELPVFEPVKQELFSRGSDDAVLAAPAGLRRLRALAEKATGTERDRLCCAADLAEELLTRVSPMNKRAITLTSALGKDYTQSSELFELTKEYCLLHAAAACVLTFVHSYDVMDHPLPSGALLLLQLERLRRQLYPHELIADEAVVDAVMQVLRRLHGDNRLFSHWQFPLAERVHDETAARL